MQLENKEAGAVAAAPGLSREVKRHNLDTATGQPKQVRLQCEACRKSFVKNLGRRKRFCSDACRKAVQRAQEAPMGSEVECSVASGNALIQPYNSKGYRAKIENPYPCRFSVPLDLLGRSHRWLNSPEIDRRIWSIILWCEACA